MPAFIVKVYKNKQLHKKYKGIAPDGFELATSAEEKYKPCRVFVFCDRSKQPQKEVRHAH